LPSVEYIWEIAEPAPDVPSPKSHPYPYGLPPPPVAVAVKPKAVSVVPDGGVAEPVTWMFEIMTDADPEVVAPFPSVTTTVVWNAPVCVYMWVIWAPEPVVPSPKDQAYPVKVPGPPVAEAVNVTFEPGAAAAWFADAITEGAGLMATDVESVALTIVASVTVHVTAMVPVAW